MFVQPQKAPFVDEGLEARVGLSREEGRTLVPDISK